MDKSQRSRWKQQRSTNTRDNVIEALSILSPKFLWKAQSKWWCSTMWTHDMGQFIKQSLALRKRFEEWEFLSRLRRPVLASQKRNRRMRLRVSLASRRRRKDRRARLGEFGVIEFYLKLPKHATEVKTAHRILISEAEILFDKRDPKSASAGTL